MASIYPSSSNRIFSGGIKNIGRLNSFKTLDDVSKQILNTMRVAYKKTLDEMVFKLREFIANDVYNNAYSSSTMSNKGSSDYKYKSKWGGRTETLLDERSIEGYIYNAFGKGIAGGIRFNDQPYYENMNLSKYIHGNSYFGQLAFQSYLEILNNNRLLVDNPFGFPTFRDFHRDSFWYDFTKWAEENFEKIFAKHLSRLASGDNRVMASSMRVDIDNLPNSMNLSSSTRNIRNLNTGILGNVVDNSFHGTITVSDENGVVTSTTKY